MGLENYPLRLSDNLTTIDTKNRINSLYFCYNCYSAIQSYFSIHYVIIQNVSCKKTSYLGLDPRYFQKLTLVVLLAQFQIWSVSNFVLRRDVVYRLLAKL